MQEFFDSTGMELTKETIGQAYLLLYSKDCEELKKGHVARLGK